MKNVHLNIMKISYYLPRLVTIILLSSFILAFGSGCEKTKDYSEFAESYHNLLFDSTNYDNYLATVEPQKSEFFYKCLNKHRARHHNEAQTRINACINQCPNFDSVCNFNCNISSGTEVFEGRRDLLELELVTLQQNLNTDVLKQNGAFLAEIDCLGINLVRSLGSFPGLSCTQIGVEYRNNYMSENHCKFKKYFYESDWSL